MTNLTQKFEELADWFRKCGSFKDVEAAAAWGGKLLKQATDARQFPFWSSAEWPDRKFWQERDDPQSRPSGNWPVTSPGLPSLKENEDWAMVWQSGYVITSLEFRNRLPVFVFTQGCPDCRELARSYACTAELIAEGCQEAESDNPPSGFQSAGEAAKVLGVHATKQNAFIRQLHRKRNEKSLDDDCWHEVTNPQPNTPHFLYQVDSPHVRDLAAKYKV